MIELKPCPFCGGEADIDVFGPDILFIFCKECGAESDAFPTAGEALVAWNTRAERTCVVEKVVKRERALGAPTWDYQLSCGHFAYEWPWKEAPAYCPDCGAKVVE